MLKNLQKSNKLVYKENVFEYAVTSKKTRNPIVLDDYFSYLEYLKQYGEISNVFVETTKGLHIHYVLTMDKRLDYNLLKHVKYGWSHKAVPIYNKQQWLMYIKKDSTKNEELNYKIREFMSRTKGDCYKKNTAIITEMPNHEYEGKDDYWIEGDLQLRDLEFIEAVLRYPGSNQEDYLDPPDLGCDKDFEIPNKRLF